MLLTWLLTVCVFIVITVLVNTKKKNIESEKFDIRTYGLKSTTVIIFAVFSIIAMIASLIMIFYNNRVAMWSLYAFGAFIAILDILLYADNTVNFEAIRHDAVIANRFFKHVEFSVYDVKRIIPAFTFGNVVLLNGDEKSFCHLVV